jgi:hypothetical protein
MHRLFFIHQNYIADSILTLQHDRYLQPEIKQTTIYFGTDNRDNNLLDVYQEFEINTDRLSVVLDPDIVNPYCNNINVNIYQFGGWIAQQLLKLIALDQCDADRILIQDCDTFAIKPVNFFKEELPVCLVVPTPTPKIYNNYYRKITGLEPTVNFHFVSEFMPVLKADWIKLRTRIEDVHHCHWLYALHKEFSKDLSDQVWFSEYQLLGLWAAYRHPSLETIKQHRFLLNKKNLNNPDMINYNFACNNRYFSINDLKNLLPL